MISHRLRLLLLFLCLLVSACRLTAPPVPAPTSDEPPPASTIPQSAPDPVSEATVTAIQLSDAPTRLASAITNEPPTLDPHRSSDPATAEVLSRICETLVYQGLDLSNKPLLAESWEIAPDGLSATFTLRDGITFHDGTPLTAEAVRLTFERLQQPESQPSPVYDSFQGVKIESPDERTVIFTFAEPRYDFPTTLRNPYTAILSPAAFQADEVEFGRHPVCTGPYEVKEWKSAQYILLGSNPAYAWPPDYATHKGPPLIAEIEINFISEDATRFLALLNGELDMLSLASSEEALEVEENGQFTFYESWIGGISFLGFNYQRPPTNELLVRQALAHAIDKRVIVDTILPGLADPVFAPLAPSIFGFSEELAAFEYAYDPQQSRQLLAEAGFSDGDGNGIVERDGSPLHLVLLTATDEVYAKIFVLIQSQLKDIGVDVEIRAVPTSEIAEITPTGEFDLLLYHYNWPYPTALSLFLSTERIGSSNRVAYSNPEMDELVREATLIPNDSAEKRALLMQAQQLILQDAPWQPLLVRKIKMAVHNRVQGVRTHPAGGLLLYDAFIVDPPP